MVVSFPTTTSFLTLIAATVPPQRLPSSSGLNRHVPAADLEKKPESLE
jgi:hypothetical protein